MNAKTTMTRREMGRLLLGAAAVGLVEPWVARAFAGDSNQVRWMLSKSAGPEGSWSAPKVEGKIPRDLAGTLVRTCPGQRENHGVTLRHIFDGDAFLTAHTFGDGKASVRARYLDTPQRVEELAAKRMLYSEFGTPAPPPPPGWEPKRAKNQPTVNIVAWDGLLLGLSEGGPPTAIDPKTLGYVREWDFHGTLPRSVPFTAHPKVDPETGAGYGYGVRQGRETALVVFRMERDGKLAKIAEVPLDGYFIVHDMLLTREHVLFLVPPARFEFKLFFTGEAKVAADAVRFHEREPMRVLVIRKDGAGAPVWIEQPTGMVFHHGNAVERDGKIQLDTILGPDGSALEAVYSFAKGEVPPPSVQRLTRVEIDLAKKSATRRAIDDRDVEFPRFDERRAGLGARYLYTLDYTGGSGVLAASAILRHDLERGTVQRAAADRGRGYGEAVFAPRPGVASEERGWLLVSGVDGERRENFVEIRDAATLDLEARVWSGFYAPLGFHGNFVAT